MAAVDPMALWDLFQKHCLYDAQMSEREKHLCAGAFWGGVITACDTIDDNNVSDDERAEMKAKATKLCAAVLACIVVNPTPTKPRDH